MSNILAVLPTCHTVAEIDEYDKNRIRLYKSVTAVVTSYYISGQYEALRYIAHMYPNCYILFVGYKDADMQPGITGTRLKFKYGSIEKAPYAAIRELKEETGFTTHPSNLSFFDNSCYQRIGRTGTIFLTNAAHCAASRYVRLPESNDSMSKVALLVYGSQKDIVHMIRRAKAINPNEGISYYACVHIMYALDMTRIIKERRACGMLKPFNYCL